MKWWEPSLRGSGLWMASPVWKGKVLPLRRSTKSFVRIALMDRLVLRLCIAYVYNEEKLGRFRFQFLFRRVICDGTERSPMGCEKGMERRLTAGGLKKQEELWPSFEQIASWLERYEVARRGSRMLHVRVAHLTNPSARRRAPGPWRVELTQLDERDVEGEDVSAQTAALCRSIVGTFPWLQPHILKHAARIPWDWELLGGYSFR